MKIQLDEPDARKVTVAGTFNGWHPHSTPLQRDAKNKWRVELALERGTYEYRLLVDGQWKNDPKAQRRVPNGFGEENCVLEIA